MEGVPRKIETSATSATIEPKDSCNAIPRAIPWGSGLPQRVLRHPPQAKSYVDYQCAYFGMIGGTTFELFVSGLPDAPDEGNQWAQKVAETAAKLTLTTIKEK